MCDCNVTHISQMNYDKILLMKTINDKWSGLADIGQRGMRVHYTERRKYVDIPIIHSQDFLQPQQNIHQTFTIRQIMGKPVR